MTAHPAVQVLDALRIACLASPGLTPAAGVKIFDGPPLGSFEERGAVALGLSIEDVAAARGDTQPRYGDRREETFDVSCFTQAWSGDVDLSPIRARAFELLDLVRAVLVADVSLGGACSWARMQGRWAYRPGQSDDGVSALVLFTVRVAAVRFEGA